MADQPRFRYDLLNLRVSAFIAVFVYHLCRVFSPYHLWPVQSEPRSTFLGLVTVFLDPHITAFFMLAGAAVWLSLARRTSAQYAGERFTRLFVPLLIGALTVVPPQIYFERLRYGQFEGSFLAFYPSVFTSGLYPQGSLGWHHLWFLAYLLAYSFLALPLFLWMQGPKGARLIAWLAGWVQRPGAVFLYALPICITEIIFRGRWPGWQNLIGDWANFTLYLAMFIYGYIFIADERFERAIDAHWRPALVLGVLTSALTLSLHALRALPQPYSLPYVLYSINWAVGVWAWLIVFWAGARVLLSRPMPFFNYAAEISYPFYILHQAVIVALAFYITRLPLALGAEFLLITACALAITLPVCEILRRWGPARALLGLRT